MSDRIVLIGSGGLGREVLWALEHVEVEADVEVVGFVTSDASQHGTMVCGLPVLGPESWLVGRDDVRAVCCIGDPRARKKVVESLEGDGVGFASVIHPSTEGSTFVSIGDGSMIAARAVLTTQVALGRHVSVGVGAIVSHDCRLEDFATLAPGVTLAGAVTIEIGAELGVGATVIPGRTVGCGAMVGAGAVVIEDVPPNQVVAGVPARRASDLPAF